MKNLMVCVMLVLGFGFCSAEKAEAGGRYCRPAPRYRVGPPRYSRDFGRSYYRSSYSYRSSYRSGGWWSGGYSYRSAPVIYSPPVVYSQPVIRVEPPVRVVDWDEESLLQLGEEKFRALSKKLDKDAGNLVVTIYKQDFQTTKGARVIEEVEYIATWTITRKNEEGKEEVVEKREKFEIEFDDYGNYESYDD